MFHTHVICINLLLCETNTGLDADLTFDSSRINNFSYMSNFSEDSGESSSGEETVPGMDEDETEDEEEIVTTENKSGNPCDKQRENMSAGNFITACLIFTEFLKRISDALFRIWF